MFCFQGVLKQDLILLALEVVGTKWDYTASLMMYVLISLTHCMLGTFSCFLSSPDFFFKITFFKNSFMNTIRMSNSLALIRPDESGSKLFAKVISRRLW